MFLDLNEAERAAFFALLDEYFESRPHLKPGNSVGSDIPNSQQRQVPAAPSSRPSNFVPPSASSRPPAAPDSTATAPKPSPASSLMGKNEHVDKLLGNKHVSSALGSVSNAWGGRQGSTSAAPPAPAPAPKPSPPAGKHSIPSGLVTSQGMGGLSTASKAAAFGSIMGNKVTVTEEEKRAARAPIRGLASGPATHGAPVPPPPRRTSAVSPPADAKPTVKALYDFESDEAGDLPFSEGAVIELLEKPSADWWKGRLNGREGLFPRNYVQEQ